VLAASTFMALRLLWFFGRQLALEEALSVGWVAWSISMAAFLVYIGLKLPLGLTHEADAPAVCIAVCTSLLAILWLARVVTDWRRAVTGPIFGLLLLTLVVVSLMLDLSLSQN
jgi:hypothetical protein